jgi:hypothetical protein
MSDSSRSEDLPVSPLPLTQKLRDELDATILTKVRSKAKLILAGDPAIADELFVDILWCITLQANRLLQRENLKDILNPSIDHEEMLVQNPKLRDVVYAACQTGKFVNIADLSEPSFGNTNTSVLTLSGNAEILQIPEPATDNTPTPSKGRKCLSCGISNACSCQLGPRHSQGCRAFRFIRQTLRRGGCGRFLPVPRSQQQEVLSRPFATVLRKILFDCAEFWYREVKAVDRGKAFRFMSVL